MKKGIAAASLVAALALVGCSGTPQVEQTNDAEQTAEAEHTESEELTDEEISDIATEYISSKEISAILELNDSITPVAMSLTDGTFDGEYDSLDGVIEQCNAVIDMEEAPDCISGLQDAFVDTARNYRSAAYSLINACSEYEMGLIEYTEDFNDFLSHYDDVQDSLEDAMNEYADIIRRSED